MSDKIYNFQTGRFIQRYGSAHKKLLKAGLTNENSSDTKKKVKSKEKVIRKIDISSDEEEEEVKPLVKPNKPIVKSSKSKKAQQKIQEILNGLSKKQIEKMNDAQLTSYVQKKFIEDCRITKDEEETEDEDNEDNNQEEDFDSDSE